MAEPALNYTDDEILMLVAKSRADRMQSQKYAELLKESGKPSMIVDGRLLMTLDFATYGDCPESMRAMYAGYIENGLTYIIGSVAKHFYNEAVQRRESKENTSEAAFRDSIASQLKADGWHVETEHITASGRIDILASKDGETRIIETKLSSSTNEVSHALGQLLFYKVAYPHATLWFASPTKLHKQTIAILDYYGVQIHV